MICDDCECVTDERRRGSDKSSPPSGITYKCREVVPMRTKVCKHTLPRFEVGPGVREVHVKISVLRCFWRRSGHHLSGRVG